MSQYHKKMTVNPMALPHGGILEIYRDGSVQGASNRPRPFTVRHMGADDESHFHSKSSLPEVAIEYLSLCVRLIKPKKVLMPLELRELWAEKIARDLLGPELRKVEVETVRSREP